MNNKHNQMIGLHVRINHGIMDVVDHVRRLHIPVAQSFLLDETGAYISFNRSIIHKFIRAKEELSFAYFVHAAYWSNLTNVDSKQFETLCKEAEMAAQLQAQGIVIHVGAFPVGMSKQNQAECIIESINNLLHRVDSIDIYLENSPHAGRNFGGDILDFGLLMKYVDQKNRVKFCLDTAHAFVYGYDLTNQIILNHVLHQIELTIGSANIGMLHLNESVKRCGSYIDKHSMIGQGLIGNRALAAIKDHVLFAECPIIIELPGTCSMDDEVAALHLAQQLSF